MSAQARANPSFRPSVLSLALAGGVVVLIIGLITVTLTLNAEARFRDQMMRSASLIRTLDRVQLAAVQAETSQRGFLLYGNEAYIAPFRESIGQLTGSIEAYETLASEAPGAPQTEDIASLKATAAERVGGLEQLIARYRTGETGNIQDAFRDGAPVRSMHGILTLAETLEAQEGARLDAASRNADVARQRTLLALTILTLFSLLGFVLAYIHNLLSNRLSLVERHALELARERERTGLLARELNHRVKNLFAVIQSIITSTGRMETDAQIAALKVRERVQALSRAHALTSSEDSQKATTLHRLIEQVVGPQKSDDQIMLVSGPLVAVPAQYVTPFGMILHELTTNAIKYGAWSAAEGSIDISWSIGESEKISQLVFEWNENWNKSTPLAAPSREGFGSRMMAMSLMQLGGSQERMWMPEGMRLRINLPLDTNEAVSGADAQ